MRGKALPVSITTAIFIMVAALLLHASVWLAGILFVLCMGAIWFLTIFQQERR